ncbi:MAG: LPS assembly protein LptD [Chthoniobacterales bacterium]
MRKLLLLLAFPMLTAGQSARAEESKLTDQPVEINSSGGTNYENGIATARDDVAIHAGDTDIYADSARYDTHSHDVFVEGHVRIYRDVTFYIGDKAVYNLDTKQIRATNMRTDRDPYLVSGEDVTSDAEGQYIVRNGTFTTHDSSDPDFRLRAHKVRIYEKDRIVFQNVTLYIGKVPVFWWPYLYQSLDDSFSFLVSPAYLSSWGPSLLTSLTFPITDNIKGRVRLDYRSRRGVALGFDSEIEYGKDNSSYAKIRSYYIQDQNPLLNQTSVPRGQVPTGRYRLSLEDRTQFTDDISGIIDITKLSDPYVLQDFYQSDFRLDPKPDSVVAITKSDPIYTLTGITRFEVNSFFEQTERLPEIVLDIKRHALFGGPIFYEGETGFANLLRNFPKDSPLQDYDTIRLDTFHQLLYPNTYFGWLSVVPRIGIRGTYYSTTRDVSGIPLPPNTNPFLPDFLLPPVPTSDQPLINAGDKFRTVFNTGVEASFKVSREWEEVQTRTLGLDGLRHIVQPFTNFSFASNSGVDPAEILQFDRYQPSTQLRPIDFPQFTSVDSIDSWTVWRVGVRNRLQTRRDDLTINWMELETYLDVNFDNPFDKTRYSNLFNKLRFSPVPWASLVINSQLPAFDRGFSEVNTNITVQPIANLQLNVGHRYLNENPFFANSSLYVFGGYYRVNDNWGVSVQEQYEATTGILEQQRYSINRDLTSWVASLGAVIRNNAGVNEYGVLLTFTLKAFPKFGFDLNFDPSGAGEGQ